MAHSTTDLVQKPHHYAIVDEIDSVLVDDARTPLIISGQVERPQEKYQKAAQIVELLQKAEDVSKDVVDPEGDYEVD